MSNNYDSRIEALTQENKRLIDENEALKQLLSSRRFCFANKVANGFNEIAPVGSLRRKTVGGLLLPVRGLKTIKKNRNLNVLRTLAGCYKKMIVVTGVAWNAPLPQRSHHIARCLAKNDDVFVVYYEPDGVLKAVRKIKKNLCTTNSLDGIIMAGKQCDRRIFVFSNVSNVSLRQVNKMKQNGFELAYECIDELDDTLSDGALVNQNEVWCNLNSLDIDYFFSTADRLTEQLGRKVLNQKVIVLKNAVNVNEFDYRRFQNAKIPEDLVGIIKKGYPIVGYYGAMSPWLDYELIHKTAKNNPDYSFVFIGVDYAGALSRLDQSIKNVYYLGAKKQKELPLYSVHFSCATIPFCSGEIAKSTSPIKLFEYMAMGLPVVCTRDLNECKGYKYVYVAKNDKEFEIRTAEAVKESGNGDVKDVLYKQAEANTWDSRANVMIDTFGL